MFPNIRLGKEINICNVQQMSCVHSMWWTSGLQTVSVCGLRPFVLGSRKYFAVKYTENLNQWITWHKQILCWLKLGTCKMKLNLSRCTNSGFQDINILMKGGLYVLPSFYLCETEAATYCTLHLQVMHIWLNTAQGQNVIREAIFLLHRIPSILENGLQRILIKSLEWNMKKYIWLWCLLE